MPANVIKEAQKRLKILEKQQHQHTQNSIQNDLFSAIDNDTENQTIIEKTVEIEIPSPVLLLLQTIDIDELTPRQALEQLYQLKSLLKNTEIVEL